MDVTRIPWDVDYFKRFVDHDPDNDEGLGVFQNCPGTIDIPIVGRDIVSVEKNTLDPHRKGTGTHICVSYVCIHIYMSHIRVPESYT